MDEFDDSRTGRTNRFLQTVLKNGVVLQNCAVERRSRFILKIVGLNVLYVKKVVIHLKWGFLFSFPRHLRIETNSFAVGSFC